MAAADPIRPELSPRDAADLLRPIKIFSGRSGNFATAWHSIKSIPCAMSMVSCQPSGVVVDAVKIRTMDSNDHIDGKRFGGNDGTWRRNTDAKLVIRVHEAAGLNGRATIVVEERYATINRAEFCDVLEVPLNRGRPRIRRINHGT